jgi:hypothetical protein
MSSMRNSRTRLLAAAATAALAALALTACSDASGARDEGAGPTSKSLAPSSTATAKGGAPTDAPPAAPPTADSSGDSAGSKGKEPSDSKGSDGSSDTSGSSGSSGSKGSDAAAEAAKRASGGGGSKTATCEGSNTKTVAAPLQRPVNHMLITVTNTGSKTCYLYGYPELQFTGAQAVPPAFEDSKPQAVVTLSPGQSGYASVALSNAKDGSGTNGRTVKSLTVYFTGPSGGSENVGTGGHPSLPSNGVHIDDSLTTSYWQQSMTDALAW